MAERVKFEPTIPLTEYKISKREDLTKLNINKDTVLDLKENHKKYIKYHRENKFKT